MRVVVTRPLGRAEATITELRAKGHEPLLLPLSRALHIPDQTGPLSKRTYPAIALTSAEALRALSHIDLSPHLATPLFAVGRKTAAAARQVGFTNVHIADGDGASLAALLVRQAPEEVVYLTGKPRSSAFENALKAANIPHSAIEIYEMAPLTPSPDDILALLDRTAEAILFHSRETARLFFALPTVADNLTGLTPAIIACFSARVAEEVPPLLRNRLRIAERPDEASLLALL